jgi:hypothetical protein
MKSVEKKEKMFAHKLKTFSRSNKSQNVQFHDAFC